jgi:hypothetical protein
MTFQNASNNVSVLANLIPLVGVIFYGWDAVLILALFWIENLIIGAFNVVKMLCVVVYRSEWSKLFLVVFFIIHYGLFWTGHGLFLWSILGFDSIDPATVFGRELPGLLDLAAEGAAIMASFISMYTPIIWLGLASLFLSHLVSFIEYFILRGELFNKNVNKLMSEPYKNVVALHAGLLGGAFLLDFFESPVWLLALIVLLKIIYDAQSQRERHLKLALEQTKLER